MSRFVWVSLALQALASFGRGEYTDIVIESGFHEAGYITLEKTKEINPECEGLVGVNLNRTIGVIRRAEKVWVGTGLDYHYNLTTNYITDWTGATLVMWPDPDDDKMVVFRDAQFPGGCTYIGRVMSGGVLNVHAPPISEVGTIKDPIGPSFLPFIRYNNFVSWYEMTGWYDPATRTSTVWYSSDYGSKTTYTKLAVTKDNKLMQTTVVDGKKHAPLTGPVEVVAGSVMGVKAKEVVRRGLRL